MRMASIDEAAAAIESAMPRRAVGNYLAAHLSDPRWHTCSVERIAGGNSNLTFAVSSSAGQVVVRRPPLSTVLPSAHDVGREYRVLAGLATADVPTPKALALCQDVAVVGAPFVVLEFVRGLIVREQFPDGYPDGVGARQATGRSVVDVLADLHLLDPGELGLSDFGRPEGYLSRQLRRWSAQWQASAQVSSEVADSLHQLVARLESTIPTPQRHSVVHGDYRLDNLILHESTPGKIAAVLDWELSTVGDPLADLGLFSLYWHEASDGDLRRTALLSSVTGSGGFPSRRELVERYATRTGLDLSALRWYVAFACFKLAAVVAGVVMRGRRGAMIGDGFTAMHTRIPALVEFGHLVLSGGAD